MNREGGMWITTRTIPNNGKHNHVLWKLRGSRKRDLYYIHWFIKWVSNDPFKNIIINTELLVIIQNWIGVDLRTGTCIPTLPEKDYQRTSWWRDIRVISRM